MLLLKVAGVGATIFAVLFVVFAVLVQDHAHSHAERVLAACPEYGGFNHNPDCVKASPGY